MKDYYSEIDQALTRLELGKYPTHSIEWVAERVVWCWKWRKITEGQLEVLCDRLIAYFEGPHS